MQMDGARNLRGADVGVERGRGLNHGNHHVPARRLRRCWPCEWRQAKRDDGACDLPVHFLVSLLRTSLSRASLGPSVSLLTGGPGPDLFRSEERRVGKECVSMCQSRWSSYHYTKKIITTHTLYLK